MSPEQWERERKRGAQARPEVRGQGQTFHTQGPPPSVCSTYDQQPTNAKASGII